jgi:hypothetical protein
MASGLACGLIGTGFGIRALIKISICQMSL